MMFLNTWDDDTVHGGNGIIVRQEMQFPFTCTA